MASAVGISVFAMYNKTRDSNITWNKSRRMNDSAVSAVDEYQPLLMSTKGNSTRVFANDRNIFESHYKYIETEPQKFTIRIGEPEEEEEEIEEAAANASEVDEDATNEGEEPISPTKKVDPEDAEMKDAEKLGDEDAAAEVIGNDDESETDASTKQGEDSESSIPDLSTIKEETESTAQEAVDAALSMLVSDEEKEHAAKTPAGSVPAEAASTKPSES